MLSNFQLLQTRGNFFHYNTIKITYDIINELIRNSFSRRSEHTYKCKDVITIYHKVS